MKYFENKHVLSVEEIKKLRENDVEVFEKLFKAMYEPLTQYVFNYLNETEVAKNIVQEVFYIIWKNRKRLNAQKNIISYLYKITRNKSLKYLKHKTVQHNYVNIHLSQDVDDDPLTPAEVLHYKELEKAVEKALDKLPEKCYTVFSMNRFNGLTYKQIAEIQDVSIKAVEKQMTRALKILRTQLKNFLFIF